MKKMLLTGLAGLLIAGCGDSSDQEEKKVSTGAPLRVLYSTEVADGLPRGLNYARREQELIHNFAEDHSRSVVWVQVAADQLMNALHTGQGDMAVGCSQEEFQSASSLLLTLPVFNPLKAGPDEKDATAEKAPGVVWAVPKDSDALLKKLNTFLAKEFPGVMPNPRVGDLAEIKKRGYIRVLTRNNPACYFLHRGQLMGFEYELIKGYADTQGLDVVMVVPPRWADLKQWMIEGRGDVVAACITVSEERQAASKELRFCHPYGNVREIVVTRSSDTKLNTLKNLEGRTVHLRKRSHYWSTMAKLKADSGIDFKIEAVPGTMETREILHRVESGEFDLTVADSGFLDIEINTGRKLRSALMFRTPLQYGWVVRQDDSELKASMDAYLAKKVGSSGYTQLYSKYFTRSSSPSKFKDEALSLDKTDISPYDELIRISAEQYGFHWCLIASQMFQESSFRPHARSWAGAQGLMQLMPATARELGLNEKTVLDPEKNIDAGVRYLRNQCKRVPEEVDAVNRICFGLAAYNGGYGHLIDARSLAGQLGRNPNIWVENVDYAYSLLSTTEYADKAKYGYCRSEEITAYVRKIIARYVAYKSEIERLRAISE